MKFNKKSFKDKLDKLWGKVIRERDKCCLVCGKQENLNAHHAIVTKARSNNTRWNLDNGVALCVGCHIFKLHGSSDKEFLDYYLKAVDQKIPQEKQDEIKRLSNDIFKENQDNFDKVLKYLEYELSLLDF